MQDTSADYDAAIVAHRTWVPGRLHTDWDATGYAGRGSLDDLSGQMAETWEVDHSLDDGYPESVTFVSGTSVPEFTTELAGRTYPSPVPVSTTAPWMGSTANGLTTAATATLTVPAATLTAGDWLFLTLSIDSTTSTITSSLPDEDLPLLTGPTVDSTAVQTVVYGRRVDQDLASAGATYTFSWTTASRYTLVGASIGARDAGGKRCVMQLAGASATNEALTSVTNHTTPTVVSTAARNVVVTLWTRATTQTATWTMAGTDVRAVEIVGASGALNNLDVAIGYGATIEAAGSFARTATTTASSNATMAIVVLSVPVWDAMTAPAWWSPMRTDSPLYGKDRDVPRVTFDTGLVTASGREYVRVFTGQMVNTPVRGGKASLQTISAARLKLMKLVQLPSFSRQFSKGIYATWPISYALNQCGLYAGPKIREGTAWHAPMHGAAWAMVPTGNRVFSASEIVSGVEVPQWIAYEQAADDASVTLIDEVNWITGPYVSAPDLQLTTALRRALYIPGLSFAADAAKAMTQTQCRGRLEMWVKGDATNVNTAPGGSATVTRLCSLWMQVTGGGSPFIRLGITPTRKVEVTVNDGSFIRTLTSTGTLATDGAWYFIGAGYDMIADRLWVNLNGTVESSSPVMTQANLPPSIQGFTDGYPVFLSTLPVAEVTFTTGAEANVDNFPLWRNHANYAPTATLFPSAIKLNAVAEAEPREAWQIITEYAKAELASVRLTELDVFEYLPLAWWVRDEQQVVTDLVSTGLNASGFDIDLDPTKIRNSVKVAYSETTVFEYVPGVGYRAIYEYSDETPILIRPGVTVIKFNYSSTGILPSQHIWLLDAVDAFAEVNSYVTLCDVIDGIGNYANDSQISVLFDAWDAGSATLRFTNRTAISWYLVNNLDAPALRIVGLPIAESSTYVTEYDTASILTRGERSLDVSAPVLQTEASARWLARVLKMNLRKAVPTIGADQQGVEVLADPRRQPGDLGTLVDDVTGVSGGLWRLRGVQHQGAGADYRQSIVARQTLPIMVIGRGVIGASLVGPRQT